MSEKNYRVKGMSCAACVARVEKSVKALPGVDSCEVNLLLGTMKVSGDTEDNDIVRAVSAAGYEAILEGEAAPSAVGAEENSEERGAMRAIAARLITSAILLLMLMYLSMGHAMWGFPLPDALSHNPIAQGLLQMVLSLAIMVINKHFFVNGAKGMVHLAPNMDTLVALGSFFSFAYSFCMLLVMSDRVISGNIEGAHGVLHSLYFESAAMILVLITVGKLLEARAKGKTTSALRALYDLSPKLATVERDGREEVISAKDVAVGDIVILKRGDIVSVDGEVISGALSVDESALTGESIPVDKGEGARVISGTTVLSGYARIRAQKVGEQTVISEIIEMVKRASSSKAPVAKAADRVAGVFVPAVLVIAFVTLAVWLILGREFGFALSRAVSVLVISCPCALGLATPVAIMVGSGVGARRGILFKTAEALELCGRVKTVAFDKTGTVTEGSPELTECVTVGISDRELISLLASAEAMSEHPLAKAICDKADSLGLARHGDVQGFLAESGGISATVSGKRLLCGNRRYIETKVDSEIPATLESAYERLSGEGQTVLFAAVEGSIVGAVSIFDKIREDSREAISAINSMGIKTVMITGDNRRAAEYVAGRVGISRVIPEVLPSDKAKIIEDLEREGHSAMVGDGINDAVALKAASVGIAVGKGTDIAKDSADVVLTRVGLSGVVAAIGLGRRVLINIYENLFWAFCYNIVGIPLAAGAFISLFGWEMNPMFGALAMSLSSFLVVMNALRLNLYNPMGYTKNKNLMQTNIYNTKENTMKTVTIKIEGMMCPHCSGRVKEQLLANPAVEAADVSHERGDAIVTLREDIPVSELCAIITAAGYKVV